MSRLSCIFLILFFTLASCQPGDLNSRAIRQADIPSGMLKLPDAALIVTSYDPAAGTSNIILTPTTNVGLVTQNYTFQTLASDGFFTIQQGNYDPHCSAQNPSVAYFIIDSNNIYTVFAPNGRIALNPSKSYTLQVRFTTVICSSLSLTFVFRRMH
jgi:hypothetical protein